MPETKLEYLITANNRANQVFDTVRKSVHDLGDSAKKAVDGFKGLTDGFANFSGAAMIAQEGLEMLREAYDATIGMTLDYADQVRDLSRTIGANATEASKLIQAADDVGVSYETITAGLESAIRRGVNPSIDGIARLAGQYNAIQSPIERTRFLLETFGRAGADLAPLMEQGAKGIQEAGKAAEEAGLAMDEKAVKSAREFQIVMDDLEDSVTAARLAVSQDLIPALVYLLDITAQVNTAVREHNLGWTKFIPVVGAAVDIFFGIKAAATPVVSEMWEWTRAIGNVIGAHLIQIPIIADTVKAIDRARQGVQDFITILKLEIGAFAEMVTEKIYAIPIIGDFLKMTEETGKGVTNFISDVQKEKDALANVKSGFEEASVAADKYRSSVGNVPIMGHGKAYKAGQGPGYAYSESNPEGYVYDPNTRQYTYPGRASGGPMFAGIPRVVGERRAEVFTPDRSGFISPDASAAGGGTTINLSVNFQVSSVSDVLYGNELRRKIGSTVESIVRDLKANHKI